MRLLLSHLRYCTLIIFLGGWNHFVFSPRKAAVNKWICEVSLLHVFSHPHLSANQILHPCFSFPISISNGRKIFRVCCTRQAVRPLKLCNMELFFWSSLFFICLFLISDPRLKSTILEATIAPTVLCNNYWTRSIVLAHKMHHMQGSVSNTTVVLILLIKGGPSIY